MIRHLAFGSALTGGLTVLCLAVPPLRAEVAAPLPDPAGLIARAVMNAADCGRWYGLDGHLHSDHSHDAGFFHQQEKRPENHDTFVSDQLNGAALAGQEFGVLTDHRTFDQHYDPDFRSDALVLLGGEEWGGYPHATVWGLDEELEQGPDEGVCGVARAVAEAHAQDAVMGVAHPEDGRKPCIDVLTLADVPLDYLEALRYPHTDFWQRNLADGRRFGPSTGSDNHFKQLYGTEAGAGGNTVYVCATAKTPAAFLEGVRQGRMLATLRTVSPTLLTLVDADGDGDFEAMTGGSAVPSGPTVRLAFQIERGSGEWLEVVNAAGEIVVQSPIVLPDEIQAFDLPASTAFYRGQIVLEPAERVSPAMVEPNLAYIDTLRVLSAPVYLTAPPEPPAHTQAVASGVARRVSDAPWAGFPDVAASGDVVHAVWQQRHVPVYEIAYSRSTDGGATWSSPLVLSAAGEDARTPTVAADGLRVVVAWQKHPGSAEGGAIVVRTSSDGGTGFGAAEPVGDAAATASHPSLAASGGRDHLAWMSMEDGYKIRYARRVSGGAWASPVRLSSAEPWNGLPATFAPPRMIRWVPAALRPIVAADDARVAVAWEDDRDDTTPLRRGTPDDWGIYAAVSSDGGASWSPDRRVTPPHLRKEEDPADPEALEGNPARHADLLWDSGALYLAYQDPFGSDGANVWVERSDDLGVSWTTPVAASVISDEPAYRPKLVAMSGGVRVIWQASSGRAWSLRTASAPTGGSFTPESAFTTGSGYAGYPAVAGGVVVWTGEADGRYGIYAAAP